MLLRVSIKSSGIGVAIKPTTHLSLNSSFCQPNSTSDPRPTLQKVQPEPLVRLHGRVWLTGGLRAEMVTPLRVPSLVSTSKAKREERQDPVVLGARETWRRDPLSLCSFPAPAAVLPSGLERPPHPVHSPQTSQCKKLLEDGQRRWVRSSCREGREGRRGRPLIVNQQTRTAASHYKWDDDLVTGLPWAHRLTWGYFDKVKLSSKAATLRRWAPRKSESQRSSLPRP